MKSFIVPIVMSIVSFPCQAMANDQPDELCAPLRAFVASVKPDETKKIEFHTSWGGNFKDEKDNNVIYAKRCNDDGYAPAEAVCAYLMENGSVEFAGRNAKRALTCLSPGTTFAPKMALNRAEISFSYGTDERGSNVTLQLAEDAKIGGMVLTISADGY
jgi:hypothetical protein